MSDFWVEDDRYNYNFEENIDVESHWNPEKLILQLEDREERFMQETKSEELPISIFRENISGLRAIVKYLKENKGKTLVEISEILGRDPRTIWTEYNAVKNTKPFSQKEIAKETNLINTDAFKQRIYSVLETITLTLLNEGHTQKQISLLLNKNPKTIWTVINRAKIKTSELSAENKKSGGIQKSKTIFGPPNKSGGGAK